MRSRPQYIITKDQVHDYANDWLSAALGCIPRFAIGLGFAIRGCRGFGRFCFTLEKEARFGHG